MVQRVTTHTQLEKQQLTAAPPTNTWDVRFSLGLPGSPILYMPILVPSPMQYYYHKLDLSLPTFSEVVSPVMSPLFLPPQLGGGEI